MPSTKIQLLLPPPPPPALEPSPSLTPGKIGKNLVLFMICLLSKTSLSSTCHLRHLFCGTSGNYKVVCQDIQATLGALVKGWWPLPESGVSNVCLEQQGGSLLVLSPSFTKVKVLGLKSQSFYNS